MMFQGVVIETLITTVVSKENKINTCYILTTYYDPDHTFIVLLSQGKVEEVSV